MKAANDYNMKQMSINKGDITSSSMNESESLSDNGDGFIDKVNIKGERQRSHSFRTKEMFEKAKMPLEVHGVKKDVNKTPVSMTNQNAQL